MTTSPDLQSIYEIASYEARIPETAEEIYRLFDTTIMHEAIQLLNVVDLRLKRVKLAKGFVEIAESYHTLVGSLPPMDDPRSKENISAIILLHYTMFMINIKPLLDILNENLSDNSEIK